MSRQELRRARRARLRERLAQIKLRTGCAVCGYRRCAAAIDFHHGDRPEDLKAFSVSQVRDDVSWDRVLAEIRKCLPLCCRCHSEVHSGELELRHIGRVPDKVFPE